MGNGTLILTRDSGEGHRRYAGLFETFWDIGIQRTEIAGSKYLYVRLRRLDSAKRITANVLRCRIPECISKLARNACWYTAINFKKAATALNIRQRLCRFFDKTQCRPERVTPI